MIQIDNSAPAWAHQFVIELINHMEDEFSRPRPLPEVTVANLPDATTCAGCRYYVNDGASDKYIVISNGTSWFYPEGTGA